MEQTQTVEEMAEEQAAFTAGFNGTDQAPVIEPAVEPVVTPEAAVVFDAVNGVNEPADKPLTMEDLRALIDEQKQQNIQHTTKLSGHIGELKQKLQQLESAKVSASGISPKAKERLAEEFPELAEMLFDPSGEDTPGNMEPEEAFKIIKEVVFPEVDEEEAKELLTFDHPDWVEVVNSEPFNEWVATLPPKIANRLNTSFDPAFVSGKLTSFKSWQSANKPVVPTVAPKPNNDKLDAAVNPRGVPRSASAGNGADDEETAAFKAAFKPLFRR